MATIKYISNDNLLSGHAEIVEVDSVGEWLADKYYNQWKLGSPMPFSVYAGVPCVNNDMFIRNGVKKPDDDIIRDLMNAKEGVYTVCDTPATGTEAILIISIVLAVASIALAPKPQLPQNVNRNQESPNNQLGGRSNVARPLERVPDIKGQVKAFPDIISPTYSTYLNHQEIEHGFYCISRKQIQVESIKDGETPLELIDGASAGVYYPGNNPNLGSPDISIGDHDSEPVVSAYRSNQVDDITLGTEFDEGFIPYTDMEVVNVDQFLGGNPNYFGIIDTVNFNTNSSLYDIGEISVFDDLEVVTDSGTIFISGEYEVIDEFQLLNRLVIFDYGSPFPSLGGGVGSKRPISGSVSPLGVSKFTNWAYLTSELFESAIINIIAPNGLYKDSGGAELDQITVDFQLQIESVDANGNPSGLVTTINDSISGSTQKLRAKTVDFTFDAPTRFRIRATRTTPKFEGSGVFVSDIKLEDVYGIKNEPDVDFGDVTVIQTITRATAFATSIKERQLNCIATELLNVYEGNGVFASELTPNTRAIQSFITDSIDPVIGNRQLSEIDADGILALDAEINSYFGNVDNGEFSYTFDSTDITYQDYAQTVLNAINCIGYREGSIIKAFFEKRQDNPSMLFTHRSKAPNGERYTREFNQQRINDGVEFNWVNPGTDTTETIYIPSDRSAVNPKKFNIAGIRNEIQAITRSNREYNKLLYQKRKCEVTTTAEGRYVNVGERIQVVKGSRVNTYDGEVLAVDNTGLILTLSQDVVFSGGDIHSVWLKDENGNAENVTCTAGSESNIVILDFLPTQEIRTGIDERRTEFSFGNDARHEAESWLAQEVDISDKLYVNLRCINYDDNYYKDDSEDFGAYSDGYSDGYA